MSFILVLLLGIPMEPAALCAMDKFPADIKPRELDAAALDAIITAHVDCMPAQVLRGVAELGLREPDHDLALAHLEQALALAPDNSDVLRWLGLGHFIRAGVDRSLSDARKGVKYIAAAIEVNPDDIDARSALADFHRGAPWIAGGDIDVAYAQADEIRRRDRMRGDVELARTLFADDEEQRGLELARTILKEDPFNELVIDYALLMQQQDNIAEAHRVLLAATHNEDARLIALYLLGRIAAQSGEFITDGRAALQRYLARGEAGEDLPNEPAAAWWRLGMIEQHDGQIDAARTAFERALEHNPEFSEAVDALAALPK